MSPEFQRQRDGGDGALRLGLRRPKQREQPSQAPLQQQSRSVTSRFRVINARSTPSVLTTTAPERDDVVENRWK